MPRNPHNNCYDGDGSRGPTGGLRVDKKITEVLTWYQESEQFKEKSYSSQQRDN